MRVLANKLIKGEILLYEAIKHPYHLNSTIYHPRYKACDKAFQLQSLTGGGEYLVLTNAGTNDCYFYSAVVSRYLA